MNSRDGHGLRFLWFNGAPWSGSNSLVESVRVEALIRIWCDFVQFQNMHVRIIQGRFSSFLPVEGDLHNTSCHREEPPFGGDAAISLWLYLQFNKSAAYPFTLSILDEGERKNS